MIKEYDLYKAMAQMMGKLDDLPPLSQFIAEKYIQHMIDQCLAEAGLLMA